MSIDLILLSRVAYLDQEVAGPRLRGLLALLAADLRAGCSTARLVEGLWPDDQPAKPVKALQVLVSRARTQLGAALIASTPTGYRLTLAEEQVDVAALPLIASSAARQARAGDHAAVLARAEEGLALWSGAVDGDDLPDDPVSVLRADRLPAHRSLVRLRALSLACLGRYAEAIQPLTGLVAAHPWDEEVLAALLRCEAATAGPAAALARYDAYRRSLRDELGSDPGPAVQATHLELLRDAAPVVRHGIPHEPNPLLGRAEDIAAVTDLTRSSRVTSIVGPGGLGKTRLAQAMGLRAEHRAVHLVPLAGVTSDGDVAGEVASLLGAGDAWLASGGRMRSRSADLLADIVQALGTGPTLLILDNCEHVIGGAAELVRALVSMSQNLQVLTTSRAPLGLSSEAVYPLPELSLGAAVELFEQRARAVRPDVELPVDEVTELCRHLDGLPLAVELAAAKVRVMSVTEISLRLRDRFALLRGGSRDAPLRHRTLQAVVGWSWNLLEPSGQAAMRTLSIFPGGFTADAARALLGGEGARVGAEAVPDRPDRPDRSNLSDFHDFHDVPDVPDVLDVLEQLVDQSLLRVAAAPSGTRFRMLETVREFSAARREEAGESGDALEGFLRWARGFGAAEHETVFAATATAASMERLRDEQDNLVQALRHGLDRSDGATIAATVAVLGGLWFVEGSYVRVAKLAEESARVLPRFRPPPALLEATRTALTVCATSAFLQGPRELRSLAALRRLPPAPPTSLVRATAILLTAGPKTLAPESPVLDRMCESEEPLLASVANVAASYVRERAGDQDRALTAALRILGALGNTPYPALRFQANSRIAELLLLAEDGRQAIGHIDAALRLAEQMLPGPHLNDLHLGSVLAHLQCGAVDEAESRLELVTGSSEEAAGGLPVLLAAQAEIRLARGQIDDGLRLWRESAVAWEDSAEPVYRSDPPGMEPWILEAQAAAVVAHAHHGRLDLVEGIVAELPAKLATMLTNPMAAPPAYVVEPAIWGAVLLALAMVDLDHGTRTGDAATLRSAVRSIALADRLNRLRSFHPTLASARIRRIAEGADGVAYAQAVREYAALGRHDQRAAALAALRARAGH